MKDKTSLPLYHWLQSKTICKLTFFWWTIIYLFIVIASIILTRQFATNYLVLLICFIVCSTVTVFVCTINSVKNTHHADNTLKDKLIKYFNNVYSCEEESETYTDEFFNKKYLHSKDRLIHFKINFRYFWISILLLFVVLSLKEIFLPTIHTYKPLLIKDYKDSIDNRSGIEKVESFNSSHFYPDSKYIIPIKETLHNEISKLNTYLADKNDTIKKCNFVSIQFPNSNFYNDTISLTSNQIFTLDTVNIIPLINFTKKEKSELVNLLLRQSCLGEIFIIRENNPTKNNNHSEKNSNEKESILCSYFDTTSIAETKTDSLHFQKLQTVLKEGDIIQIDSSCYLFYRSYSVLSSSSNQFDSLLLKLKPNKNELQLPDSVYISLKKEKAQVKNKTLIYFENKHETSSDDWWKSLFIIFEFLFNNLSLYFLFVCFLSLYVIPVTKSEYEEEKKKLKINLSNIENYGLFIFFFLFLSYTVTVLSALVAHNKEQLESTETIFNAISGLINGIVFCMLIGRLDSKFMGLRSMSIAILFIYPAIQPLFIAFGDEGSYLMPVALAVSIFMKVYFFVIICYLIESGRMITFFFCFPEMERRINSIYANQFEVLILKNEHHNEYYFEVRNKNEVVFMTNVLKHNKTEIEELIVQLQKDFTKPIIFERQIGTIYEKQKEQENHFNQLGTNWLEYSFVLEGTTEKTNHLKNNTSNDRNKVLIFSKEFKNEESLLEFENEVREKLPYCKVGFEM